MTHPLLGLQPVLEPHAKVQSIICMFCKCFENILPFSEIIFVLLQADFRFAESGCKRFVEQKMYQRMMDDILKQINAGEVSGAQFKERILDKYDIACELVAFSNSHGGKLVVQHLPALSLRLGEVL